MPVLDLLSIAVLVVVAAVGLSLVIVQLVTGVPPQSSSGTEAADVIALLKQGGLPERAVVYELGSGWGSLVIELAQAFPEAQIRGVEMSPFPYWVARFRTRNLPNVLLQRANYYTCDLTEAQAVTCYLMIESMPKLAAYLDRMLKPGTPVVSLSFWFRDRKAAATRASSWPLCATAMYHWPALDMDAPAREKF
jgi:cyclopropane fatty-acyl-phospholipid synthase-like methyltransferase